MNSTWSHCCSPFCETKMVAGAKPDTSKGRIEASRAHPPSKAAEVKAAGGRGNRNRYFSGLQASKSAKQNGITAAVSFFGQVS